MRRHRRSTRRAFGRKLRRLLLRREVLVPALLLAVIAGSWLFWPYFELRGQFANAPLRQPSRLYEAPPVLAVGTDLRLADLAALLVARGYRDAGQGGSEEDLVRGTFHREGSTLRAALRSYPTPAGIQAAQTLDVTVGDGEVKRLVLGGKAVQRSYLEPRVLASYYGPDLRDRWPEAIEELPLHVVRAVLAAEDDGFFRHTGLSPSGMLRALWVNVRGGEVRQGGSTVTQQLVKNLYLTPERSLPRKLREAAIALLVELRFSKEEILQAYLNEAYFGSSGSVQLLGIGAAARAFFGVPASELDVAEAATLAGMIRAPARLSPVRSPEAAKSRRDEVLRRMAELGWLEAGALEQAIAKPLEPRSGPADLRTARYAAEAAAEEAAARFGTGDPRDAGYSLVATIDYDDQRAAEAAVRWGLGALEQGWERGAKREGPLQAALLSVDPRNGAVLAWVGGRDWSSSQFDRVRFARRQPGSAFKPIVLAAAFAERVATPADLLADEPLTVVQAGQSWSPQNDDHEYSGMVTVREAIERSLNVPTVRLALLVGLDQVVAWARRLGIEGRLQRLPSVALGAFEVSPRELLQVYAVFAAAGRSSEIHLLQAVLDREGAKVGGQSLAEPRQVLEPGVAYLVTSVLEGVIDRGTGSQVRRDGLRDVLAGKSGTSNDGRDSWFIGYAPQRATLVWVGYDRARRTRLSGSRAALPIWGRFTASRRPRGGYSVTLPPSDVTTATVDPRSGQLATGRCPEIVTEVFLRDGVPTERCELHDRSRRDRGDRRSWWRFWRRGQNGG
ncbi:MAG TPA: transglycosylase domain-containing protein [Thermoanaerobaculia bacterium]|nr:transglycosylase domain-containing protein [Thermoanaerobaculia bacterium]